MKLLTTEDFKFKEIPHGSNSVLMEIWNYTSGPMLKDIERKSGIFSLWTKISENRIIFISSTTKLEASKFWGEFYCS